MTIIVVWTLCHEKNLPAIKQPGQSALILKIFNVGFNLRLILACYDAAVAVRLFLHNAGRVQLAKGQ
jgi:hypothetical protein